MGTAASSDSVTDPLLANGSGLYGMGNGGSAEALAGAHAGGLGGGMGRRTQSLQWLNAATESRVAGACTWGGSGRQAMHAAPLRMYRAACELHASQPGQVEATWGALRLPLCSGPPTTLALVPATTPAPIAGGARRFSQRQVEEVKLVLRLLPIFATTALYWTIYMQVCVCEVGWESVGADLFAGASCK